MPVSIPKLSRQNDEDAPGTEALIAAAAEKPEDNTDNLPIANGTFWVKQTHLGFCPTDVMLQIRPKGIVLLNDDYQVVEYKYANLVMWTQSRSSVTLMLQSNLKRIVLKARGRLAARKIVVMLHDVTQMLQRELHRKKAFWGLTSLDLEGVEMSESSVWMPTQSSQFESADSAQDSVEGVKMFRVKQTHMPEHPAHVMLRIDQHGLSLCHRETGEQLWSCGWGTILMWRADDAAVVLVFTESNRQIELLCPTSQDILDTMTAKTQAVARAMQGETHIHHSFGHTDKRLPKAPLEFRRELLTFEAPTVQHHERWKLMNGQTGLRGIFSLRNHQNMLESVKAREQLHAIFSVADSDGSGSLDVGEVGELLRSLNIYAKDGTEFQRHDIQLMMIDMDAFGNEVTFDGFVHWALSSTSGAGASELLKKRVEHRKKEVAAIGQIFDQLDQDGDGMLDRADFKEFVSCVGLSLNDKEFYQTWGSLDRDRGGEISFEEFFRWYKRQTIDQILVQLQRSLRLTRLLANAKGAMVYAVDQGNQRGKVALQSLFDCVDNVGTELITHEDLMALVHDLRIDADEYDVIMAMREIDQSGKGKIDLKKWTKWWCNSPSDSASAILRSKMKLAAFTAKDSGPMLQVVGTTDAGAGSAEGYLNELLQAAFAQKSDLQGRSLGIFGPKAHFRIWCSHLIQNPLTDRVLVVAIFGNVALMAAQTPGQDSTVGLAVVNFGLMVVFTAEMGLRIVANGLVFGETAYLTNSWDLFDCVIISAVWVIYVASLYFDIDKSVGFGLAMLRSFRALRFFSHIRNILGSIIAGRVMIGSVLLLLAFLFMLTYVIGFQLFAGVMDTTCGPSGGCPGCGMLTECPSTLDCTALYPGGHACYSLSIMNETLQNTTAPRAAPTFGFDTFGTSVLTVGSIITFDGWFDISVQMRQAQVAMRYWAWPAFASAVVWIGLFTVNLFLAGLAYSFIKVRKTTRNLDAHGALKKTLVERMLNDKATSGQDDEKGRHLLQLLHPPATRRARQLVNNSWFLNGLLLTVLVNVGFMAADHHNPSEQTQLTFAIAEAIFTAIYTFEMCTKLQAMGFLEYFKISLNRLDFIIVMASLSSYWLLLFKDESSNAKGSAVLRMLRVTKVIRAARVAKIIFRSDAVKQMTAKAFAGLDAIISLLVFIVFMLTLAAIAGMQLFHNCSDGTDPAMSHTPNFETFWQSLLVAWQVMTLDSWTSIMIDYMDCAGNVAAVYFVVIASTCAFVLGNLFVAIFMENFEIKDEEKRDMQVGIYMQMLAQDVTHAGDSKAWLNGVQKGIQGVEDMLAETSTINVLRRRTLDEFLKGAKLTKDVGKSVGKRGLRIKPIARQVSRCNKWWEDRRRRHTGLMSPRAGLSPRENAWRKQAMLAGAEIELSSRKSSFTDRKFWRNIAETQAFHNLMLLASILSLLDTTVSSESSQLSTNQHAGYIVAKVFVYVAFAAESLIKFYAFRFLGESDPLVWPSMTTSWELCMVVVQITASLSVPYTSALLPLRSIRILYMVKRLSLMVEAFLRSLTAVWTALLLMAASFLAFGIVGMNLFAGLLWHCPEAIQLDRAECIAAGLPWENRPFHFDNIVESSISMFSVWSLQGWTTLWYWTMDATEIDEAPRKDYDITTPFLFFASFIMWNSLMLTNLFTGMLCDFFAQSSGSILMTSEQRNWQFMSMFLVESLRLEVVPPPDEDRWFGLASVGFNVVHSKWFRVLVDLTIVASVVSMVGQQSMLRLDPTGLVAEALLTLDELALVVFTLEAFFTLGGLGIKVYFRDFRMEAVVCATMWTTVVLLYLKVYSGIEIFPQLQAITFIRAMRLITVVKRIHAIKKIHFLVMVALPQVVNLCCIMVIVFVIYAAYANMLCGNAPHGALITEYDNFDTVRGSFRVLFQLCTGMSMTGINHQCSETNGKVALLFFIGFFFFTNMMLVNLFIALLLDNFDLMGSEDMAVSDMDIKLFKRRWVRYAGGEKGRQTIHDSISLAQVRRFIHQPGMGTFSMMPQADPYYFNRVLFELHPEDGQPGDYTIQDALDCESGLKDVRVFFFDLLLALCHIRFSSSCLTLANEVNKSALLVEQHEQHAARIIQVGARAFMTRKSMNVYGDRAAPGFVWVCENSTGENPQTEARLVQGRDYPDGPEGRCVICTLPKHSKYCDCKSKAKAQKEEEEYKLKLRKAVMSRDQMTISKLKSSDVGRSIDAKRTASTDNGSGDKMDSWDQSHDIDSNAFMELKEDSKRVWDSAVNVAMFLTLRSLINVDRITPEHVVADAFDQLQEVVDKRKKTNRRGLARLAKSKNSADAELGLSDDAANRTSRKSFKAPDQGTSPDFIMHEMRKLNDMDGENRLDAFRMYDEYESGCVSSPDFGTALCFLGLQLSPEQLRVIDSALDKEQDGTLDYEEFLENTNDTGMDALEAKLMEQAHVPTKKELKQAKKDQRKQEKAEKKEAKQRAKQAEDSTLDPTADGFAVFSNPLDSMSIDASQDQSGQSGLRKRTSFDFEDGPNGSQMKFVNPLAGAGDSVESDAEDSATGSFDIDGEAAVSARNSLDPTAEPLENIKGVWRAPGKGRSKDHANDIDGAEDPTAVEVDQSDEEPKVKLKQRPSVYHYKVTNIGKLRTAMEEHSAEIGGHLGIDEVVIADDRQLLSSGVGIRINGSRFGADYAFTNVTAPDGSILLEFMHDDAQAFVFRALTKVVLSKAVEYSEKDAARSKTYAKKQRSGKLKASEKVEIHSYQTVGGVVRLKLHDSRGWVTLVSEDGEQRLEAVRPLDILRLHLHSLTLDQLRTEAVRTYQVDPAVVAEASSEAREVDPKGATIALCVDNWRLSTRGTDHLATLIHNADGLVETLVVDDRVIVQSPIGEASRGTKGKLGRVQNVSEADDGSQFVVVVLDGERATRVFGADELRKHVDERIATSLFGAVMVDDTQTLARLLASTTVPPDARFADHTPIPAGHLRVAKAVNHAGQTLYEVATLQRKKHCAAYLACRLMFQAVVDDDVATLEELLRGAGTIDAICPHGAFAAGEQHGTIATADGEHTYPRNPEEGEPLIERARRVWQCNGEPATAESARQLGGRCWFVLSERWEDRFGMLYEPPKATEAGGAEGVAMGLQSIVTASRMRRKLEESKDERASASELEGTLKWKERNAFMTRKTQIS